MCRTLSEYSHTPAITLPERPTGKIDTPASASVVAVVPRIVPAGLTQLVVQHRIQPLDALPRLTQILVMRFHRDRVLVTGSVTPFRFYPIKAIALWVGFIGWLLSTPLFLARMFVEDVT
jgi:ABC-type arginine transport system ATPase subunit